jgi:hypothetical protein
LARLHALRSLDLLETSVTDAGLAHLARLHALRSLDLLETSVTDTGVEQLKKSLPDLRVVGPKVDYQRLFGR